MLYIIDYFFDYKYISEKWVTVVEGHPKKGGIKYHFWVIGVTRPVIEPLSPGPLANTQPTWLIYIYIYIYICVCVCVCVCVCMYVCVCVCVLAFTKITSFSDI